MKLFATLLLAVLPAAALPAAPAHAKPGFVEANPFDQIPDDYKHPLDLPESSFNPFKIQAVTDAAQAKRDAPSITNDAVAAALDHRGLSGLLYGATPADNRVIIGDEVFGVGDELSFTGDKDGPLVTGASVVLRSVAADSLILEITPSGEATRTLHYSLRGFWRP